MRRLPTAHVLVAAWLVGACAAAPVRSDPTLCPAAPDPVTPTAEVDVEHLQAVLEEAGLEVSRLGRGDEGGPKLLVLEGDPKVILSVNERRTDVEMAVIYAVRGGYDDALLPRLNALNQRMPCQASLNDEGSLLLEYFHPYDEGLRASSFVSAVQKFRRYGLGCAMHVRDVLK